MDINTVETALTYDYYLEQVAGLSCDRPVYSYGDGSVTMIRDSNTLITVIGDAYVLKAECPSVTREVLVAYTAPITRADGEFIDINNLSYEMRINGVIPGPLSIDIKSCESALCGEATPPFAITVP